MIDNINLIKPLLNFSDEGDFYMLYVFKRKKDQPEGERDNHQSVRTIKAYCINSIAYLDMRYDEIKQLCELAMNMITEIVTRIQSGQINQQHVFDSVVGQIKTTEKRWIIDVDDKNVRGLVPITSFIHSLRPEGDKVEACIPTRNGYHLITKRFDAQMFKKEFPSIDIQKKNPTLLYYPNSLD